MDVIETINKLKEKIIPLAILCIALFVGLKIYKGQSSELDRLKESKDVEIKKNQALLEISNFETDMKEIKTIVNSKDVAMALDTLGNVALSAGVRIVGIRPQPMKDFPQYLLYSFDLSVAARSFNSLGKFTELLETHKDVFFVESVVLRNDGQEYDPKNFEIKAEYRVSTIVIKD